MKNYRVKYFPKNDLACGWGIERIEELYRNKDAIVIQDINDVIEYYNLYRYFNDDNLIWKNWTKDQVSVYKDFSQKLKTLAFNFVAKLNDSSFISSMKVIDFDYVDDLLTILQMSTKFRNISPSIIDLILKKNSSFIYHAIKNEAFVNHYGEVICRYLISHNSAEIIITSEDSKNNNTVTRTYLPKCLLEEDRNVILEKYINSTDVNINYLSLLITIPFEKKLPVPLIVCAKNKLKECQNKLFATPGKTYSFSIRFDKEQKEKAIFSNTDAFSIEISYSLEWINSHLTYDAILYNFVDMFCFVDGQYRIMNMNKVKGTPLLNLLSMQKNSKLYQKNIIFDFFEGLLNHELFAYRNILLNKGIHLEKMIETFFSDFIVNMYNFPNIKTHLSVDKKSYLEKCHEIVTNIDIICKQFYHFTKYKKIDKELLQVDNNPIKIECIPSLVKNKYIQGCGNNYHGIVHSLFSNQCMLSYYPSNNIQYENFYDLLRNENIFKSGYPEYEYCILEELEKWDLIKIEKTGQIIINNINRLLILKDIYDNQFVNFNRFDEKMKNEMIEMEKLGLIEFVDTLLSRQESAYLNFYLNETYPNGPKLRNKYAHGIEYLEEDENVHFNNYIILLRLLIMLTLKINDDICLYRISENKKN